MSGSKVVYFIMGNGIDGPGLVRDDDADYEAFIEPIVERGIIVDGGKETGTYQIRGSAGFYLVGLELTAQQEEILERLANNLRERTTGIPEEIDIPIIKHLIKEACVEGKLRHSPSRNGRAIILSSEEASP